MGVRNHQQTCLSIVIVPCHYYFPCCLLLIIMISCLFYIIIIIFHIFSQQDCHTWRAAPDSNAGRVAKVRILVNSINWRTGCTHSMDSCLLGFWARKNRGKIMAASPEENNKSEKIMEKTWKILWNPLSSYIIPETNPVSSWFTLW